MRRYLIILMMPCFVVLFGICCLAGCEGSRHHLKKVRLNEVAHSIFYAPQYVAIEKGYFEKEGIAAKLFRKYPALLKSSADLHQVIMQEQLAPHRAPETEWERQMLRTEVKHYIDTSGLAYSYNEFYTQNMPDKVAWKTLQSDLFANLPQIKAERMPRDFSVVLPKLWRKRQAWNAERTKRPPYRGEER